MSDDVDVQEAVCRECWEENDYCVEDPHSAEPVCADCAGELAGELRHRRDVAVEKKHAARERTASDHSADATISLILTGLVGLLAYRGAHHAITSPSVVGFAAGTAAAVLAILFALGVAREGLQHTTEAYRKYAGENDE